MSRRILVSVLLLIGIGATGFAQEAWSRVDEQNLAKFKEIQEQLQEHVLAGEWSFAEAGLRDLRWFLTKWSERGHARRPEVVTARKAYQSLSAQITSKSSIDPTAERTVRYVRREGGKAKGGGTREVPAKFFWRELEKCKPGDEIRVSGPILGWRKSGKLQVEVPHLTIRGGFSPDFSTRDVVKYPTIVSRPEGSTAKDTAQVMFKVSVGGGLVLDGLVFDQAGHNVYGGGGNLDSGRSRVSPTLAVNFTGKVAIRNCGFVNASFGAVLLAASDAGEATVENCVFLNCAGPALRVRGEGARFIVRRNTFALVHARSSTPGSCIELGKKGTLVAEDNVFSYADYAVTTLLENLDMTVNRNVEHALGGGFLLYAESGRTSPATIEELEEVDLNEAEQNVILDPELPLDPTSLLKYLRSTLRTGLEETLIKQEVERATSRLSAGAGGESGTEGGASPEPKGDEEDPFGEDPFGDDPFGEDSADTPEGDEPESGGGEPELVVPSGPHYAPAYPASRSLVAPENRRCMAGARLLQEDE